MRLSQFILSNLEEILMEWESFARTIIPTKDLDQLALRDHAAKILEAIALDIEMAQTELEQAEKSKGRGNRRVEDTAAETHSAQRLQEGFNQVQMISEYRALRESVSRLWLATSPELDASALSQLTRFNEAMDQAVAESTARCMQQVEASRDFALAVLAHDLRNPLNAMITSGECLTLQPRPDEATLNSLGSIILDSGTQMSKLIETLLDFTRTRLGSPLLLKREPTSLRPVFAQTIASLSAAYADRTIQLNCNEDPRCAVDAVRIRQMLSNLVANTIQHGAETSPITVTAYLESDDIVLQVHNDGPPIPASLLPTLFDFAAPRSMQNPAVTTQFDHLGIGLYITRKIVEAHGGDISVTSTAQCGTTFEVRLPCLAKEHRAA